MLHTYSYIVTFWPVFKIAVKGIVHPKIKMTENVIQDVDELVSSSEQI